MGGQEDRGQELTDFTQQSSPECNVTTLRIYAHWGACPVVSFGIRSARTAVMRVTAIWSCRAK